LWAVEAFPVKMRAHPVKSVLMRRRTLYALGKLAKMIHQVPVRAWADLPRLQSLLRVLPNTMLSVRRLINAYECVRTIENEKLTGAIVECGVCSGGCIGLMALASRRYGDRRRTFHLFDSFQGLPQPSLHDGDVVDGFRSAHPGVKPDDGGDPRQLVPINVCVGESAEKVKSFLLHRLRLDPRQIMMHCGWFQETVPAAKEGIGRVAILRLDGDLYESTRVCLKHLYDLVIDGGFVIIDDYGTFEGCRNAVDEFFSARHLAPDFLDIDGHCVFFRKPATPDSTPGRAASDAERGFIQCVQPHHPGRAAPVPAGGCQAGP
jgi:O-methyltransferase